MSRRPRIPTHRLHVALPGRAILATLLALPGLGCSMFGLAPQDPMRAEYARLEREEKVKAAQEQRLEEFKERERAKNPDTVQTLIARGDAHLAEGKLGAALWDYASAYELDPKSPLPRERVGYVHLRQEPERAQPLFESALDLDPKSVSAHVGLGLSKLAGGDREGGIKHLERAVELDPRSPKAQAALGVSLDQLGRREEAIAHLEAARELRPHDSRILNNLGVAYLRAGQPERAEPLFRAALRETRATPRCARTTSGWRSR
jgi:Flp pilus assembly protein TadD